MLLLATVANIREKNCTGLQKNLGPKVGKKISFGTCYTSVMEEKNIFLLS
jgi:hypothetical protein